MAGSAAEMVSAIEVSSPLNSEFASACRVSSGTISWDTIANGCLYVRSGPKP